MSMVDEEERRAIWEIFAEMAYESRLAIRQQMERDALEAYAGRIMGNDAMRLGVVSIVIGG